MPSVSDFSEVHEASSSNLARIKPCDSIALEARKTTTAVDLDEATVTRS